MKKGLKISALVVLPALCSVPAVLLAAQGAAPTMSFFVTSVGPGKGANLGGLAGADAHCQMLAQAKGAGNRTWRAYLSTTAAKGAPAVNANDRIGKGPWYNAKGAMIAQNVAELHSKEAKGVTEENIMTEAGGRASRHDALTGSQLDGSAFPPGGDDRTCANWTSSGEGRPWVGHTDLKAKGIPPSPWNSAHASAGCSPPALQSTGGDGLFYCFAAD
jgi:hypothetical protein